MRPEPRLYVQFRNQTLSVFVHGGRRMSFHAFSLRESTEEGIVSKLAGLKGGGAREAVLVLPREEVLMQDFELAVSGAAAREELQNRLGKSFPFPLEELSYGIRYSEGPEGGLKGSFLATPNEKLGRWMAPVERAGYTVSDVTSTDEALFGYLRSQNGNADGKALYFDANDSGLECVLIEGGRISFSRVFTGPEDFFGELRFLTMDYEGMGKIYLSGNAAAALKPALEKQFQVPVERLPDPVDAAGTPVPCSLFGAAVIHGGKYVSILPADRKARKKALEKKRVVTGAVLAGLLVFGSLASVLWVHEKTLEAKLVSIERRISSAGAGAVWVKKMHAALARAGAARQSNQKTLSLLKDVMIKLPSGITVKRMEIDGKRLALEGESPDNALVADAMGAVKSMPGVRSPRLEYSRARYGKSAGFEFMIVAEREP